MKIKKSDIFASCVEVHSDDGRRIIRVIKCLKGEYYTVYAIYPAVEAQECICKRCKLETAHRKATEFIAEYEAEHPAEPQQAEPQAETAQETPAEAEEANTAEPQQADLLTAHKEVITRALNRLLRYSETRMRQLDAHSSNVERDIEHFGLDKYIQLYHQGKPERYEHSEGINKTDYEKHKATAAEIEAILAVLQ